MKSVFYHLPRSKPRFHLHERCMDEAEYQKKSKNMSTLFNGSGVEGVYETKIPLLLRAIIQLEFFCQVVDQNKVSEPFLLENLQAVQTRKPQSYFARKSLKFVWKKKTFIEFSFF